MLTGIYKISNTVTNDCYIGSSKDIKTRWRKHTNLSAWKKQKNNKLYIDFQKYGLDKFSFEILEETTNLKEREQYYIDLLKPAYNNYRAFGLDLEKLREAKKRACKKNYYKNQKYKDQEFCFYDNKKITFGYLRHYFSKKGIPNPTAEAKKFLLQEEK